MAIPLQGLSYPCVYDHICLWLIWLWWVKRYRCLLSVFRILDDVEMYEQEQPFPLQMLISISGFLNSFIFHSIWDGHIGQCRSFIQHGRLISVDWWTKKLITDCEGGRAHWQAVERLYAWKGRSAYWDRQGCQFRIVLVFFIRYVPIFMADLD